MTLDERKRMLSALGLVDWQPRVDGALAPTASRVPTPVAAVEAQTTAAPTDVETSAETRPAAAASHSVAEESAPVPALEPEPALFEAFKLEEPAAADESASPPKLRPSFDVTISERPRSRPGSPKPPPDEPSEGVAEPRAKVAAVRPDLADVAFRRAAKLQKTIKRRAAVIAGLELLLGRLHIVLRERLFGRRRGGGVGVSHGALARDVGRGAQWLALYPSGGVRAVYVVSDAPRDLEKLATWCTLLPSISLT